MPEPVQIIRFSWSVGKCSLQSCWARGIKKTKQVATLKKFHGRHHDLVNPYNVAVSRIVLMFLPLTSQKHTPKILDIRFYLHFLRSGLWAWWAKLAYQVMLTIRGRLITPFILGSMSVGLNILIRHSFTDLWDWFMAWVPWQQLLNYDCTILSFNAFEANHATKLWRIYIK